MSKDKEQYFGSVSESLIADLGISGEIHIIDDDSPDSQLLPPGSLIANYYIEKQIGHGGMGQIYKAVDKKNNNIVAIKQLKNLTKQSCQRFYQEYSFLQKVQHENLIKAYDFIDDKEHVLMVLEFVEGISLKKLLEDQIQLPWLDKIAIANKISRGIEVLNTAGIIHRDIKPANIIVNLDNGTVKILDLGLGKNLKNIQHTSQQMLGTVMYLSPEQTEGKVSERSDIFSLGVVLYQLFSGNKKSPFYSDNPFRSCYMIASEDPPCLQQIIKDEKLNSTIKRLISDIVIKAMRKQPEHRWTSAKMLAEQFTKIYKAILLNFYKDEKITFRVTQAITPQLEKSLKVIQENYRKTFLSEDIVNVKNSFDSKDDEKNISQNLHDLIEIENSKKLQSLFTEDKNNTHTSLKQKTSSPAKSKKALKLSEK